MVVSSPGVDQTIKLNLSRAWGLQDWLGRVNRTKAVAERLGNS